MRTHFHKMGRTGDDRGAALVEFALLFPIFMTIVLGMLSGGLSYHRKLSITSAAREGARYGATLSETQAFTPPSLTWAEAVRDVIVERAGGVVNASQVCVALVTGGSGGTAVGANWTTDGLAGNCFGSGTTTSCTKNDNAAAGSYTGKRVHVCVARPSQLDLLFTSIDLSLRSSSNARFEG